MCREKLSFHNLGSGTPGNSWLSARKVRDEAYTRQLGYIHTYNDNENLPRSTEMFLIQ